MNQTQQELENLTRVRQKQCKQAAIYYKKSQNLSEAKLWLEHVKTCNDILEKIELVTEEIMTWEEIQPDLPPVPPLPPSQFLSDLLQTQDQQRGNSQAVPTPKGIPKGQAITQIQNQIRLCALASAYYLAKGLKPEALKFHRIKKTLTGDLDQIQSSGSDWVANLQQLDIHYTLENQCLDIKSEEYQIVISKFNTKELKDSKLKGLDVYCRVTWDIGYPEEGGKGDTPENLCKLGTEIELNFVKTIPVERNRPFQRHLERKRATFELVYRSSGVLGYFASAYSLGKASVKLDALLTKSEIVQTFPVS
jgi:hypothetical protein